MLSNNIVTEPSVNPVPGRCNVDDDIPQNNNESSPLTSEIDFVSSSAQKLFIQNNTSMRPADGFLTRVWRCLQASDGKYSSGNIRDEEGTELKEVLTMGETLRQQANSLSAPSNEAPIPQAWKGSLLQRCLVGAGLLAGTGVLGGAGYAGYKYYNAGTATTGTQENNLQPGSPYTTQEAGGSLEDAFGHHALHHDDAANRLRHHRRHLSTPTPTPTPTPVSIPISTPVSTPVLTPVSIPISTPVLTPVSIPISTPVLTPVSIPISTPVSTPVLTPVSIPVFTPVLTPVSTPVSIPASTPASSTSTSVSTLLSTPASTSTSTSTSTPAPAPASTSMSTPASTSAYNTTESKLNADEGEDNIQISLEIANDSVIDMLCNKGLLSSEESITKEKMLYEISMHLYNSENINTIYEYRIKSLAQTILSDTGIYGENKDEILSTQQAESVVRDWVFKNIIGTTPEKHLENKIKIDSSRNYTINDIHRLLPVDRLPVVSSFKIEQLSRFERLFVFIMWRDILLEEMPFLAFKDERTTSIPLNHDDFANLYSGSRFIKDIKGDGVTVEEIISTGEAVWKSAMNKGIQIEEIAYYKVPAILFYATTSSEVKENREINDINIVDDFLNYKIALSVKKDIEDKYHAYESAMKSWLTKENLVEEIIGKCLNFDITKIKSPNIKTDIIIDTLNKISAREGYLNGFSKPCESAPNNLDDEYKKLTNAVADRFHDFDKYIILYAIKMLPEDELEFISSPQSIIRLAKLVLDTSVMASSGFISRNKLDIHKENVDIFIVQQDKQERIYILKKMSDSLKGYKIIRIDRDINKYLLNDIFLDHYKGQCSRLNSYMKNREDATNELCSIVKTNTLTESDHVKSLVDTLGNIHRTAFFNRLYEEGNDKSELQKVWAVMKHIIPFYDCIEANIQGNREAALPACMMDVISLLPLIKQTVILGEKFGMSLVRGVLITTATGGNAGIKAVGKNILREVALPTTMELASLGKNTLMTLDPGFSLITSTARASRKYGQKIIKLISRKQETTTLVKNLETRIAQLPQATSDTQVTGILPGTELEIPVAAIRKNNNQNIYVAVNPETGEKFGTKYFCLKNGILESVSSLLPHILTRNTRSDESIYMRKSINTDEHNILRIKRAGDNSNLCSELPSTSRASQTHAMNPLLRRAEESPEKWARRLLELNLPIKQIAKETGISHSTIQRWPDTKTIIQQRTAQQKQSKEIAAQLMNKKEVLTYKDLQDISEKTNIKISTLGNMNEYKSKRLISRKPLTTEDKDKIYQMFVAGDGTSMVSFKTDISIDRIRTLRKEWQDIASKNSINTLQRTANSLLDEIRELRKTHSTVPHVPFEDRKRVLYFLSSANNQLSNFERELNTIAIAMDHNNKLYISFNNPKLEFKLKAWARESNIQIIKSTGHAEESLINAVPSIRHIEPSHDICLDCELLLLKKNIGTTRSFSHKISKKRKFSDLYSDDIIDYSKKLKSLADAKKLQHNEATHLLLESKLSITEIERKTGIPAHIIYSRPEYKIWKKKHSQLKKPSPRQIYVMELHGQGKSIKEIVKMTGEHSTTVYRWIGQAPENLLLKGNSDQDLPVPYSAPDSEDGSGEDLSEIYYDLDSEDGSGNPLSEIYYDLDPEDGSGKPLSEIYYDLDSEDGSGDALPGFYSNPNSKNNSGEGEFIMNWA